MAEMILRAALTLVIVQFALPLEYVSLTSSPTPILVRVRSAGLVAMVSDVMLALAQGQGGFVLPGGHVPASLLLGFGVFSPQHMISPPARALSSTKA